MYLVGTRGQQAPDYSYRADGTITAGGTSQLVLPIPAGMSSLLIQNQSAGNLYFEFGSARATATISNGTVSAVTVTNGGFGFTYPPHIDFLGGGGVGAASGVKVGAGQPGYAAPNSPGGATGRPAQARAVLTSGVITSIVIDDPGAGYSFAPYVKIVNAGGDAYGCADPYYGNVSSGVLLSAGGSLTSHATVCPTEQIAVWGATTGQVFMVRWTL